MRDTLPSIARDIVACERCPELRRYCSQTAQEKRRAYKDETYWGKPLPPFGDPKARLLIIGLAPAAHGGNRTGRMFTGDASGNFLYGALFRAGFSNQPTSVRPGDGLQLKDAYITAVLHCAPPGNKPTPRQLKHCRDYLIREVRLLKRVKAVLCLGRIAFDNLLVTLREMGVLQKDQAKPSFGHGKSYRLGPSLPKIFAAYHPSQQNTFTGRLTPEMMDQVLSQIRGHLDRT
ncbi:MAG: uracil-DNA glycosylase [Nitrospirae bacterium]|nr:uracil-DNA glycosylase [Nitrospirota bacterium]